MHNTQQRTARLLYIYTFYYRLCSSTQDLKAIRVHSDEEQILLWPEATDEADVKKECKSSMLRVD